MTIAIDELERIVKAGDRYGHNTPGVTLELITEVRALRKTLSMPLMTRIQRSAWIGDGMDGMDPRIVEEAFIHGSPSVTVYYGEKRVYTSMAAFCAAHPKEKA